MTLASEIQLHDHMTVYDAQKSMLFRDAQKQVLDWYLLTSHPIEQFWPIVAL